VPVVEERTTASWRLLLERKTGMKRNGMRRNGMREAGMRRKTSVKNEEVHRRTTHVSVSQRTRTNRCP